MINVIDRRPVRIFLRTLMTVTWFVRSTLTHCLRKPNRKSLLSAERRVFSQNGEDGILLEIFRRIGVKHKTVVEIGVGFGLTGLECNSRHLVELFGWSGVWIDANRHTAAALTSYREKYPIQFICERVTTENLGGLLTSNKVAAEFDLLSIDVDGNDYHLWKCLAQFRPRVVVIEYNALRSAQGDWVMPYNPEHIWDNSTFYGATLKAYTRLGNELGYYLVGCDSMGINAFFVRNDLFSDGLFEEPGNAAFHEQTLKWPLFFARLLPRSGRTV